MNDARFADEIRERERVRRRREMLWNAASVAFHVALVAVLLSLQPRNVQPPLTFVGVSAAVAAEPYVMVVLPGAVAVTPFML